MPRLSPARRTRRLQSEALEPRWVPAGTITDTFTYTFQAYEDLTGDGLTDDTKLNFERPMRELLHQVEYDADGRTLSDTTTFRDLAPGRTFEGHATYHLVWPDRDIYTPDEQDLRGGIGNPLFPDDPHIWLRTNAQDDYHLGVQFTWRSWDGSEITPGPYWETEKIAFFHLATNTGQVFDDRNGNGGKDAGGAGLAGASVVIEKDGRGNVFTTDANGVYSYPAGPGQYRICQDLGPEFAQTTPGDPNGYTVTVDRSGQVLSGLNYGRGLEPVIDLLSAVDAF